MTVFEWRDHKGICISREGDPEDVQPKERILTNGLQCLPWSQYMPEMDESKEPPEEEEEATTAPDGTAPRTKLTRSEKRELRQSKKISAQRKRQLKRQSELDEKGRGVVVEDVAYRPYMAKQEIKHLFTNIILNKSDTKDALSLRKDFKILQYHSIALYRSDLEHILPGEWLNDNDISFVYELLVQIFIKSDQCRDFATQIQLLFPSLVQLMLHFPADDIENLLPMSDLSKSRFIFLPINFIDEPLEEVDLETSNNGDHWALGVLSLLENKLYIYDSMRISDNENDARQLMSLCAKLESCPKLIKGKITVVHMKCDQQRNFDDCGVFVIMITCYLVSQLLFHDRISLDVSNIQLNALDARLYIMKLIAKLD
ncbi:uncharacterized protein LODBEIA_P35660 [Lodderomyces beijingensis]|uniref:Ubiquitin-like protease family profile domain-containing protein n=1 Tax=Lodderomyces beijingensis TaxID=1775926 RepID=A0ABP0ZMH4_9ASCO